MQLAKLTVAGFRSLKEFEIDFANLTVLIGENDAGKSSMLDLLDIFLGGEIPDGDDFYLSFEGDRAKKFEVICEFSLGDRDDQAIAYSIDGLLSVKKVFDSGEPTPETLYLGQKTENEELNIDFRALDPENQKALIRKLNPDVPAAEISNLEKRNAWFKNHCEQAPKVKSWMQIPTKWGVLLPRFERYSPMDYKTPNGLVAKTLKQVFEQTIFETVEENGQESRQLIPELRAVEAKAKKQLAVKINELESHIKRYNKKIKDFGYEPEFDFLNSLKTGEFTIDAGRGFHPLSKIGDGTKRRMFMAVMDWDKEILLSQAKQEVNLQSIIRGYDEPDTNLHYGAQRLMYQTIEEIVNSENSRVQAIMCTHSLAMIDRAPSQNIRMLSLDDDGCTTVNKLITQNDPGVEKFLLEVARELGITNSVIFYERCFVLIEGETEENLLPVLYKKLYKRSMVEDGIRVINVRGNGSMKDFLKLLSNNRFEYTLVFVDKDTETNPSAKLTKKNLRDSDFRDEFLKEHVFYVGEQSEIEDSFSSELIVACLQKIWPKRNGDWQLSEIENLRTKAKFSNALGQMVASVVCDEGGKFWTKPEFGKEIAEICTIEQIPDSIKKFFEKARQIAGVESEQR